MKLNIFLLTVTLLLSINYAFEVGFNGFNQISVIYPDGSNVTLTELINDGNTTFEMNFGSYNELTLLYPNGYNVTVTKPFEHDEGNEENCSGCCYCNGVQASMCMCGNSYCCYNSYVGKYYTCSSSTCCNEGANYVGCWQNTGCAACSW